MNVLGLITARGGSKGIPGKNITPCGGKPLLAWTCEAATGSQAITRTVISTDSRAIAGVAIAYGVEAPFLRPAALSDDTARSIDVAQHALGWARDAGIAVDLLVLLQPTSPLRTARHIDEAVAKWSPGDDSVVSVIEVPHRFKPWSVLVEAGGHVRDYVTDELPFERHRRQGQPVLYARNGPAIVVSTPATIAAGGFYGERCVPYEMGTRDSVDIDEREDLEYADYLLRQRGAG